MVAAVGTNVTQARVYAVGNYPAVGTQTTQSRVYAVSQPAGNNRVTQSRVYVIATGQINNPKVRAWTFTLDGHDFYVLRCGNAETLVYDVLSKQWYNWGSASSDLWKAYNGCNWIGGKRWAYTYGSDVVVGDDGNGSLYFLNPDIETDDNSAIDGQTDSFTRVAQGVVTVRGYGKERCYGIEVLGSIGESTDATLTDVTLEYSDDKGATYTSAGTISLTAGDTSARLFWRSLGSMSAPARIFRITDTGALRRLDSMDMVTGQTDQ